jgi:hypothetical protein
MVKVDIKGVFPTYKTLADGTVRTYWYHRATRKRLHGEPGSPQFMADDAAAEKLLINRHAGTLNGLIRDYSTSPEFEKLADSTRREYRRMLTKIEGKFGRLPLPALDDARVRQDLLKWRAAVARSSGEREADHRLSVVSAMLTWGRGNGRVLHNHISGFRRLHSADRSDKIWLAEHVKAFMKVAPVELQRALILALHTGQRQGDLLRLRGGITTASASRCGRARPAERSTSPAPPRSSGRSTASSATPR